jgi:hypothetical protein
MSGVFGKSVRVGVGDADPVTILLPFKSDGMAADEELLNLNGSAGTRSQFLARFRMSRLRVGGPLTCEPTPVEMAYLLPKILGGAPSGTNYPLAETLPTFFLTSDRVAKVFKYAGCGVGRATLRASVGSALETALDLIGQTETIANAGTFPGGLTPDATASPFVMTDLAVSIGGTPYQCSAFELVIDNAVDAERFLNSATLVSVQPTNRLITCNLTLPYGDAAAVYGTGAAGVAVVATFTNGTVSVAFSMPKLVFPRKSPTAPDTSEVMLPVQGIAAATAVGNELTTTLDSTP